MEGARFTIRTDHDALRWILNMADATGKLARWRLRLSKYEFDVVHRAGIKHQSADALSRLTTSGNDDTTLDDGIPVMILENGGTSDGRVCYECDDDETPTDAFGIMMIDTPEALPTIVDFVR